VLRIDAIPSTSLDGVKEWLGSMDIKFYESKVSTLMHAPTLLPCAVQPVGSCYSDPLQCALPERDRCCCFTDERPKRNFDPSLCLLGLLT